MELVDSILWSFGSGTAIAHTFFALCPLGYLNWRSKVMFLENVDYFTGDSFKVDVKEINSFQYLLVGRDIRGYSHIYLLMSLSDAFKIRTPGIPG